ncbi:caffeoyl-CoA O-methyltransferase [Nakamurella sp. UYEF19]|uniref:O-methyltransferase n=1 Tax=Nakamurella sp. UYEF19 TaxID=1756392 RepID=UPI003392EAAD
MTSVVDAEQIRSGAASAVSAPGSPRPVTPVGIVAGRLEGLLRRFDKRHGPDDPMVLELREILELASGLDPYLSRWTTPESASLQRLSQATEDEDWSQHSNPDVPGHLEQEMLSGHVEGQVLKMLVHATRARRVLEIGMFTGYSALAIAEALPPDGRVIACEIDPEVAAFAQRCFLDSADGDKIIVEVGPALPTLQALSRQGEAFDLVFIDADKAGYLDYFETLLDAGLLAPHALVCVDNTLMQGQPWTAGEATANGAAIAGFNRAVAADPRVEQVIVPLRDGLTLIRRVDTA